MPKSVYFLFFLLFGLFESIVVANDLDVKKSRWNGFERHDFKYKGVKSLLVIPDSPAKGYPWVWRARFFGHQPQADIELLKRGFHLAYCDVAGLFGNQVAVERWNEFYQMLITQRGLSKKPALEGMSRGGLIIYNWASENPERFPVFMETPQYVIFVAGQAAKEKARVEAQLGEQPSRLIE